MAETYEPEPPAPKQPTLVRIAIVFECPLYAPAARAAWSEDPDSICSILEEVLPGVRWNSGDPLPNLHYERARGLVVNVHPSAPPHLLVLAGSGPYIRDYKHIIRMTQGLRGEGLRFLLRETLAPIENGGNA